MAKKNAKKISKKKSEKPKPPVAHVPRLGPPVNLRPAGPHADKRDRTRAEIERAALDDSERANDQ